MRCRISARCSNILSGGSVSNTSGYIGYNFGSNGEVTVNGPNATWTNSSSLYVGYSGTGSLGITGGGTVSSYGGNVGGSSTGSGTVTVDGAGSTWSISSGGLAVGSSGTGRLDITGGGSVSNTYGVIGNSSNSNGTVTVAGAGSTWTNSDNLTVGSDGTGKLIITNGGVVTSANGRSDIGYWETGNGTVEVSGAGSRWTISGYLTVGLLGTGSLSITNGGAVSNSMGYVGNKTGAYGTVTVDGAGSTWTNSMILFVGTENGSRASLHVTNGGAVVSNFGGTVAINAGSVADITVDGAGSKWTMTYGDFEIGRAGTGTMSITNGGAVSDVDGNIANNPSGIATVTVDGAGSTWTNSGNLYVAAGAIYTVPSGGNGTLNISNGGTVSAVNVQLGSDTGGQGIINIGAAQGAPAVAPGTLNASTLNLKNYGLLVFNHTDMSGNYVFAPVITGGSATTSPVDVFAGTTVMTGVGSNYFGRTTVYDGAVLAAGAANVFSPNSDYVLQNPGTLLDLRGNSQTVLSLTNAGLVNMGTGTPPYTVLTTTNYIGQGGTIAMNTYLGTDGSPSDKLVIDGGTATGNTFLRITNAGGPGVETTGNGILVVEAINSGTTAVDAFALANRELRDGAFDYRLYQGGLEGSDPDNWYLRNTFGSGPGVTPPDVLPPDPPPTGPGTYPIIGPEIATYGVVQPMAQQLGRAALGTHDERMGDLYRPSCEPAETKAPIYTKAPVYTKARTDCGADGWRPAIWGRLFGQQIDNHYQAFADPRADGRIAGFQAGFDVVRSDSPIPGHRDYAGVFVGYGNANVDVTGLVTNAAATAYVLQHTGSLNLNAWSGGAYWTHYGTPGWYVDLVLQGTSYGGAASTEFARLDTSGSGFISSLEGGYPIALPLFGPGFVLEPQAQVLWQRVSFDASSDGLGPVALGTSSETTARLGLKGRWTITTDSGQLWQPYVRANVWSDFGGKATTMFGGDRVPLISQTQYMDVDAGFTTKINTHLSAFTDAGYQFAVSRDGGGRRDGVKGTAGLRYQW